MRACVKILVVVVPALLAAAAGAGRIVQNRAEKTLSLREQNLQQRLDSLSDALSLLGGMDSLYRASIRETPAVTPVFRPGTPADSLLEGVSRLSPVLRETVVLSEEAKTRLKCIPSICPLKEGTFRLAARFGQRTDPIEGDDRLHTGIDLACPQGNPVHVTGDGVVEFIDNDIFGYGNCVIVNHGYGYQTRYAHMSIIRTSENIRLKRGDVIGETGVSGRATGPHLHYEVIYNGVAVDPEEYMKLEK